VPEPAPTRGRRPPGWGPLLVLCWLAASTAWARLDLAAATVDRLDNGLTVIVLEEAAWPVVSVQMLYRAGAKHEPQGASGLAHFVEHMAFRDTENFPGTGVVGSIYAVGGEWHAYTWLDQTTYYATAPREQLDLLLRIEADRMGRLLIPADQVEAERGAILAELHGYENDPATVLQDYLLYTSFLAHPYRNNTIGWESDVRAIRHAELVAFYRRHYQPGNAVLAVVGDVRTAAVLRRVAELFAGYAGTGPAPEPRTREPAQQGERRVRLHGAVDRKSFRMAWRAPSVRDPEFPAFLLAQELLAGGSGVSFLQNDWGTPARPGSPLAAVAEDVATWYPPMGEDYVFTLSGSLPAGGDEAAVEEGVVQAIAALTAGLESPGQTQERLVAAQDRVLRELIFDVQSTEDAAHQLAFFAGLDALGVLVGLPAAIRQVRPEQLAQVLRRYLGTAQRTVGWSVPAAEPTAASDGSQAGGAGETERLRPVAAGRAVPAANGHADVASVPEVHRLRNRVPLIVQRSPLSGTAHLQVVVPGAAAVAGTAGRPNDPVWGVTSLDFPLLAGELEATLDALPGLLEALRPIQAEPDSGGGPEQRLEQLFADLLGLPRAADGDATATRPLLIVVTGDIEAERVRQWVEQAIGGLEAPPERTLAGLNATANMTIDSVLDRPVAQERLGYIVRAPGPNDPAAAAWWMMRYVLSHGYEGRLGQEAISRQGLVYYIDSAYRSNGRDGWITLSMGVDPAKLAPTRELLRSELARLRREPPSPAELAEARSHLLGRFVSAAQSNEELAGRLARQWLWHGELVDFRTLDARLSRVTPEDVQRAVPEFIGGTVIAVRSGGH
jgi:zinc protease